MGPEVELVEGEVLEAPQPNEVYVGLYRRHRQYGKQWQISGVLYHQTSEVLPNLAAFCPQVVLIVRVKIPEKFLEAT